MKQKPLEKKQLSLWTTEQSPRKLWEGVVGPKPIGACKPNEVLDRLAVGFIDGGKVVFKVNRDGGVPFQRIAAVHEVHSMPVSRIAWFDYGHSVVSGAGDFSIHFGPLRLDVPRGTLLGSLVFYLFILLCLAGAFLVLMWQLEQISEEELLQMLETGKIHVEMAKSYLLRTVAGTVSSGTVSSSSSPGPSPASGMSGLSGGVGEFEESMGGATSLPSAAVNATLAAGGLPDAEL